MDELDRVAQYFVAGRVAEIVVDPLEAVEIDEQAAKLHAAFVGLPDRVIECPFEPLAVEQAGEVVGDRLGVVAAFRLLQRRDIGHDGERQAAFTGRLRLLDQHRHQLAIRLAERNGDLPDLMVADRDRFGMAAIGFVPVLIDEIDEVAADDVVPIVTGRQQPVVADGEQASVYVEREQHGGRQVVDIGDAFVRTLQFGLFALEPVLHLVEIGGKRAHFVVGGPVDPVA
ncbi:hypothetical protein D9M70_509020 [compost metagenome]